MYSRVKTSDTQTSTYETYRSASLCGRDPAQGLVCQGGGGFEAQQQSSLNHVLVCIVSFLCQHDYGGFSLGGGGGEVKVEGSGGKLPIPLR